MDITVVNCDSGTDTNRQNLIQSIVFAVPALNTLRFFNGLAELNSVIKHIQEMEDNNLVFWHISWAGKHEGKSIEEHCVANMSISDWPESVKNHATVMFYSGGSVNRVLLGKFLEGSGLKWHFMGTFIENQITEIIKNYNDGTELIPHKKNEVVTALSILCQGYLAVHSDEATKEPAKDALVQMGWPPTADYRIENIEEKKEKVTEKEYWNIFGKTEESVKKLVKKEWEDSPNELDQLINNVCFGDGKIDNEKLNIVAAAYIAIAKKIEGKSGNDKK